MNLKSRLTWIALSTVVSIGAIILLHIQSDKKIHTDNNFTRRFMHKAVPEREQDLGQGSYYFAGVQHGTVFLASQSAPLQLSLYDSLLDLKNRFMTEIDRKDLPFQTVQLTVAGTELYVVDPTIPALFKGPVNTGKVNLKWQGELPLQRCVVIDSSHIAYSFINDQVESELGLANLNDNESTVNEGLLQKQVDGLFDSDGALHFDPVLGKIVFLYHYRNQFIVTDTKLSLLYRGKTIDTNTVAKIQVAELKERAQKKLATPPLLVNMASAVYRNLLFIRSGLKSRNEPLDLWKAASVIDVYDLQNGHYVASFYVYDIGNEKLQSFVVEGRYLYGIIGKQLVKYKLGRDVVRAYTTRP